MATATKRRKAAEIGADLDVALDALSQANERKREASATQTSATNEITRLSKDIERLKAELDDVVAAKGPL